MARKMAKPTVKALLWDASPRCQTNAARVKTLFGVPARYDTSDTSVLVRAGYIMYLGLLPLQADSLG